METIPAKKQRYANSRGTVRSILEKQKELKTAETHMEGEDLLRSKEKHTIIYLVHRHLMHFPDYFPLHIVGQISAADCMNTSNMTETSGTCCSTADIMSAFITINI